MAETFDGDYEDRTELDEQAAEIRRLNNKFRRTLVGGQVLITPGVEELSHEVKMQTILAIRSFEEFNEDNDPYGTHEFGEVVVSGTRVWFKIDAYDQNLEYGSPDPADPDVTTRVVTVLLPNEY